MASHYIRDENNTACLHNSRIVKLLFKMLTSTTFSIYNKIPEAMPSVSRIQLTAPSHLQPCVATITVISAHSCIKNLSSSFSSCSPFSNLDRPLRNWYHKPLCLLTCKRTLKGGEPVSLEKILIVTTYSTYTRLLSGLNVFKHFVNLMPILTFE